MNYKTLIVIALALCLCVSPALAVGKFYENKIVPYDGVAEFNALPQNLHGTLQVHLRSSDNFLTPEIGIKNQIEPNGTFRFFPILPDGTFEMQLIPGRYDLFLKDGNGGQPEQSTALIIAGMTSYPERELLGHAYSGSPEVTEPISSCPIVTTFGWLGNSDDFFWFNLANNADIGKWTTIQYTVNYQKEIPCPEPTGDSTSFRKPKCYEPATHTGTLMPPKYAPPQSTTPHLGMVIYPSGKHKDEDLTSVIVKSCKDAQCESEEQQIAPS